MSDEITRDEVVIRMAEAILSNRSREIGPDKLWDLADSYADAWLIRNTTTEAGAMTPSKDPTPHVWNAAARVVLGLYPRTTHPWGFTPALGACCRALHRIHTANDLNVDAQKYLSDRVRAWAEKVAKLPEAEQRKQCGAVRWFDEDRWRLVKVPVDHRRQESEDRRERASEDKSEALSGEDRAKQIEALRRASR
jgi:hypothetical protein